MVHSLLQGSLPLPFPFCPSLSPDFHCVCLVISSPVSFHLSLFMSPLECSPTAVTLVSSLLTSHQLPLQVQLPTSEQPIMSSAAFLGSISWNLIRPGDGPGPTGSCWNDPSVNTWPVGFKSGPWNCVASVWTQTSPLHLGNLPSISEDQLSSAKQCCCAK